MLTPIQKRIQKSRHNLRLCEARRKSLLLKVGKQRRMLEDVTDDCIRLRMEVFYLEDMDERNSLVAAPKQKKETTK